MSTAQNPNVRVGVGVYLCYKDKLIFLHRAVEHGGGTWSAPGGHLENGESWQGCAKREVEEELGITEFQIEPTLHHVTNDLFPESRKHYITLHMVASVDNDAFVNGEPHKHDMIEWRRLDNLPAPLFPSTKNYFNTVLRGEITTPFEFLKQQQTLQTKAA